MWCKDLEVRGLFLWGKKSQLKSAVVGQVAQHALTSSATAGFSAFQWKLIHVALMHFN